MKMLKRLLLIIGCLLNILPAYASNQPQPLPVDQAFQFSVNGVKNNQLLLHWQIAPGYHLYRDRFHFLIAMPSTAELGQINLPAGTPKHDDILGDYQIYTQKLDLQIPFTQRDKKSTLLLITYQGCSEANFCYPPVTKRIQLNGISGEVINAPLGVQDKITDLMKAKNYGFIWLAFIGFGLLLSFTPCVLPMVPILSGIIIGQNRRYLTTKRAFLLSLAYVLGMSLSYAIAGILVALAGSHLAEAFQAPWVIVLFSLLFIVLGLSLFGLYELRLPHFLQHSIVHLSNKQRPGSYIGVVIMGALSVLIVSPCVTAPLVGVLTFIAQTGDIWLGSTALFAMGLGMGIPLLIIGTTEGKFLPKSGQWMHVMKASFGVLFIAIAIYLLQRVLPGPIVLLCWAAFLIILAIYLGVGTRPAALTNYQKFAKGLGYLAFFYGVMLLVGGALGNTDSLQPLKGLLPGERSLVSSVTASLFRPVKNLADVQQAIMLARQNHKPVLLDFYADWCVACHEMDRNTFAQPQVQAALKQMVLLRANVTANDALDRALEDHFNVVAPPTLLFFDQDGNELVQMRIVGVMGAQDFLQHLQLMKQNT